MSGSNEVTICECCQERVAEIVSHDKRALCSPCHLRENRPEARRPQSSDSDE